MCHFLNFVLANMSSIFAIHSLLEHGERKTRGSEISLIQTLLTYNSYSLIKNTTPRGHLQRKIKHLCKLILRLYLS